MIEEPENTEETTEAADTPDGGTGAPAAEAPAPAAATPDGGTGEPAEQLHPKERRRRSRSQHSGEAAPERSPEERTAERQAARAKKAAERRRWRKRSRERRRAQPKTEPLVHEQHGPGRPRIREGVVISDKADKTITVRIDVARRHRVYKKIIRSSSTLAAHDERNEAHPGDTVRIVETRPLSRSKRWRLVEVVERAR